MMRFLHFILVTLALVAVSKPGLAEETTSAEAQGPLAILVVLDGLRPDYITEERTPNLHALAAKGVRFDKHHAIFPTVTRMNAASIATGTYPAAHGLMDNTIYIPEVDPDRPLSTADYTHLIRVDEATEGKLLHRPSLGEILHEQGHKLVVCSAGSSGSAFLLNHRAEKTGALINPEVVLPESIKADLQESIGPAPAAEFPNTARNTWALNALLDYAIPTIKPTIAILWLSDPDHTAHAKGIGSDTTREAIAAVDVLVGKLLEGLEEKGLSETTNIMLTSDHGFVTYSGDTNPYMALRSLTMSLDMNPNDLIFAGNGIYFREATDDKIAQFVMGMQGLPWMGPIFTHEVAPGIPFGTSLGTLSTSLIRYNHPRAPHILYAPRWDDEANEAGYAGGAAVMGIAGHGGFSSFEVRSTLIGVGPAFKQSVESPVPSDHVDLAPTLLQLIGLAPGEGMEGRVLSEGLKGGPNPESIEVTLQLWRNQFAAVYGEDAYHMEVKELRVGNRIYHEYGTSSRGPLSGPLPF